MLSVPDCMVQELVNLQKQRFGDIGLIIALDGLAPQLTLCIFCLSTHTILEHSQIKVVGPKMNHLALLPSSDEISQQFGQSRPQAFSSRFVLSYQPI